METKNLYSLVYMVMAVGLILGVGILVLDYFSDSVKVSSTISEMVTISTRAGTTANDEVSAVTSFGNVTYSCSPINVACVNVSASGAISTNTTFTNGNFTLVYTYDKDTYGTTTLSNVIGAISPISTTWLTLIVTVAILALILSMVIRSFGNVRN